MEYPKNEALQLLQQNIANFIARDLKKKILKTICQNSIKVNDKKRNYQAYEVRGSLPETSRWSHPAKLSRTLSNVNCRQNETPCKTHWQWSGAKYCIAPSTKDSQPKKRSSEMSLPRLATKKFEYQPKAIQQAVLKETNMYRKLHQAKPLIMDSGISNYAQDWANHLAYYDRLETRPCPFYGENIMRIRKPQFSMENLMKHWYQEKYNHDYIHPKFSRYTGHFTQMVWRNTNYLGVGVASNDYSIWIVCNYDPPGNIRGHFQENVFPRRLIFCESTDEEEEEKKRIRKLPSFKLWKGHYRRNTCHFECNKK